MDLINIVAGALVGLIIGITGVGGGSLMTPILVLGFGVSPIIAVGTDLLYATITKFSGVLFHHKNNTCRWRIVLLLAGGSIPMSLLTLSWLAILRQSGSTNDELIMLVLGTMLVLTAVIIFLRERLMAFISAPHNATLVCLVKRFRPQITILCGGLLGIVVTISSVGAGAIGTAILFLLYPRLPAKAIVGTDLAHAVLLTAIAGTGHLRFGSVDFDLLLDLLAGGVPAIYLGSIIGRRLPDHILRISIAFLLLATGAKLLLG